MSLKTFLQQQGFIQHNNGGAKLATTGTAGIATSAAPVYFPAITTPVETAGNASADPSFVQPLATAAAINNNQPDAAFVKFFEDELVRANLPGPDYFEFRQQLQKTQEKMAARGVAAPELILQAVLTSFEAQDVPAAKLAEAAQHYKQVLQQKNAEFLNGAAAEKNNQLKKRQEALQVHDNSIKKLQQQLQQLQQQQLQLQDAIQKETTQLDVDKGLGKEGIDKIEKAERMIGEAYRFMQASIDHDIQLLTTIK